MAVLEKWPELGDRGVIGNLVWGDCDTFMLKNAYCSTEVHNTVTIIIQFVNKTEAKQKQKPLMHGTDQAQ